MKKNVQTAGTDQTRGCQHDMATIEGGGEGISVSGQRLNQPVSNIRPNAQILIQSRGGVSFNEKP